MDLNASPLPEEDEDYELSGSNTAGEERIETAVQTFRRVFFASFHSTCIFNVIIFIFFLGLRF